MEECHYLLFDRIQTEHWWFVARAKIVETVLTRHLGPPPSPDNVRVTEERLLADIGCGTGAVLPILSRFGRVFGIDSSSSAVEICRERGFADVYLPDEPEWQPHSFDVLTVLDVIEHVDDDRDFLQHYLHWLKPHGLLLLTAPAYMSLWSEHDDINQHRRRYTKKQILALVEEAGFRPCQLSYFNTLLFPAIATLRFAKKLIHLRSKSPRSDFELTTPALNSLLQPIFASERHWLKRFSFPFGLSILCVARK